MPDTTTNVLVVPAVTMGTKGNPVARLMKVTVVAGAAAKVTEPVVPPTWVTVRCRPGKPSSARKSGRMVTVAPAEAVLTMVLVDTLRVAVVALGAI